MGSEPGSQFVPQGAGKDSRGVHSMVMLHVGLFSSAAGGFKRHADNRTGRARRRRTLGIPWLTREPAFRLTDITMLRILDRKITILFSPIFTR